MLRRDIVKITAYLTGAALSVPLMVSLANGCTPIKDSKLELGPNIFTQEQIDLLKDIADTILPKTDSPSASEVGVPEIIVHMLEHVYTKEFSEKEANNFKLLEDHLGRNNAVFAELSSKEKRNALFQLETSSVEDEKKAFINLKQQIIATYLSTEEIGTQFLNYLPVPGAYEPCISLLDAGGIAWSS